MFKLLKKSSVIRESLVEVINKSGETKKEIARQINVSQQSLSDWTTLLNTKPVTLENAQALTDHFRDSDFTLQVIHEFFGLFKSIDGDVYRKDPSSLDKLQMIESDERKQIPFCPLYNNIGMTEKIIIHWVVPKKKYMPATIEIIIH